MARITQEHVSVARCPVFLKYLSHRAFPHDSVTYKQLHVTYIATMFWNYILECMRNCQSLTEFQFCHVIGGFGNNTEAISRVEGKSMRV